MLDGQERGLVGRECRLSAWERGRDNRERGLHGWERGRRTWRFSGNDVRLQLADKVTA